MKLPFISNKQHETKLVQQQKRAIWTR